MVNYLRAIWGCRFFWFSLVKMDLRTRYRRSVLGMGWSLLHPIAMTLIICTMFRHIFGSNNVRDYAPFLLAGLACWQYILVATLQGCQCLFQGESYIRQYPAPIAIYPLRTALGGAIHFMLALCVVVALTWFLHGFGNLPALVSLAPALVLLLVLGWSLAVLAAFANVYFQDTQHLAEVVFQLLFYATPIIYDEKLLRDTHMEWLLRWNPFVSILRLVRQPILEGRIPSPMTYATATFVVLAAAAAATMVLGRLQRRLVFYL
jgi:ABC-type polysaccharide/polyol phosphate export permease